MEARLRRRLAVAIVLGAIVCVALVLLVALAPNDEERTPSAAPSPDARPAETLTRKRVHGGDAAPESAADPASGSMTDDEAASMLPRICRLDVQVQSDVESRPLPEATVVYEDSVADTFEGVTDETGLAILHDVSWSAGRVRVTAAGYAAADQAVGAVPLGGRKAVTVRLQDAIPLRVVVRDSWSGDPVAFARVRVFAAVRGGGRRGADSGPLLAELTTAEDGEALLEGVPNGACVISVTGDGLETSETGLTRNETPDSARTITVWTSPGGTVHGRVLTEDGNPVPRAQVRLGWGRSNSFQQSFEIVGDDRNIVLPSPAGTATTDLWRPMLTRTDGEGRYRIDGVRRGPGFYIAALDVLDRALSNRSHLRFTREQAEMEIDLVAHGSVDAEHRSDGASEWPSIDVPIGDAVVTGRVVDAAGEPVNGMRVWIAGETHATFSEPDGRFEIRGLVPGDVTVRARRSGEKAVSVPATAPADGLLLRMPESAESGPAVADSRVSLRFVAVLRGDGPPPSTLMIFTSAAVTSVWWTGTERTRSFAVTLPNDPGPGKGTITITAPGLLPRQVERPAVQSGVIDLGDVTLDTGRVIRGTVVDDLGAPIAGATVTIIRAGRSTEPLTSIRSATTGRDGRFVAGGLPHDMDGAWEVIAVSPRHAQGSAAVRGEDGAAEARVALRRLIGVRVVVRDEEGLPMQGVSVRATHRAGDRATTGRAGAVEVWLPPGRHSVRAYDPTTAALSAPHVVELTLGNASTEIVLTIPRGAILEARRK